MSEYFKAYLVIYGALQDLHPSLHGMQRLLTLQELAQVPALTALTSARKMKARVITRLLKVWLQVIERLLSVH